MSKMIKVAEPIIGDEEINAAIEVLKSGIYVSGKKVDEFEKRFSEYIGVAYGVACNSGTAALHMSLLALGIGAGDEVIVPPMSFFATVSAVLMVGATPVFSDVDEVGNMSYNSLSPLINENTKAIIPVHLYGYPCEIDKICEIANRYQIPVIEDCAQAHGASLYTSQKVGSFGKANCFSFFATKNMTTIEGGMITTDDPEIYRKCKMIRSHGMTDRDTHSILGYNYRMTELNAAIGLEQLKKLDNLNRKRIVNSLYLKENINFDNSTLSTIRTNNNPVYFWFPVFLSTVHSAEMFKKYLKEHNIGFRTRYKKPLYKQEIFRRKYDHIKTLADKLTGTVVGLPNHANLSKEELDYIVETVNKWSP